MRKLLFVLGFLISISSIAQSGLPQSFYYKWYDYKQYVSVDSGFGEAVRDTNFRPSKAGMTVVRPISYTKYLWTGIKWIKSNVEVLSVTDFGANGDDDIDDINAFEPAIVAARGKKLIIPSGKFILSRTLVIDPAYPIIIEGQGQNVYNDKVHGGTVLSWNTNAYGIACVNPDNAVEASHSIEIRDLAMFGNDTASFGISTEYIHNMHLTNLWISGFKNNAVSLKDCWGMKLHKVVGTHCQHHGLYMNGRNNNVTISQCAFNANASYNGYANLYLTGGVGLENLGVTISGSDFSYAGASPKEVLTDVPNIIVLGTWGLNFFGNYSEVSASGVLAYFSSTNQNLRVDGNYWQDGSVIFDDVKNSSYTYNTWQRVDTTININYLSGIYHGVNGNNVYSNYNKSNPSSFFSINKPLVDSLAIETFQKVTERGNATNKEIVAKSVAAFDGDVVAEKVGGGALISGNQNGSYHLKAIPKGSLSEFWLKQNGNAPVLHTDTSNHFYLDDVRTGAISDSAVVISGGEIKKVLSSISTSSSLDYPSISSQSEQSLTITLTGAIEGDAVSISIPATSVSVGVIYTGRVSAPDTVIITAYNITASPVDPSSGIFKVKVLK